MRPSRREFLKSTAAASLGAAGGFICDLSRFNAFAAETSGYKALVCVFLFGGMDCHDTILPYDTFNYNQYASLRNSLFDRYEQREGGSTRTREALLPMSLSNASDFGGRQFAMPPELGPLHQLFEQGACSVVSNVGPLIVPMNREQFRNRSAPRPPRLFSHNDQQSVWMASQPEGASFGWGGRLADVMLAANANPDATFTVVSTSGNTVFLSGQFASQFDMGSQGPREINGLGDDRYLGSDALPQIYESHLRAQDETLTNILQRDYSNVVNRSIDANRMLSDSFAQDAPFTTVFPQTRLGRQLQAVARVIALRDTIGVRRQIFFTGIGGFDSHSNQANSIPNRHVEIAEAMRAFYDTTVELGVSSDVTSFTASDFGRTLTINRDGTDHGWGAHHMVVGDGLLGSQMVGSFPEPAVGHDLDVNNGRLIPTTSVDQFASTLANWFGLSNGEVNDVLPGITNFDQRNLGLFGATGT
ncbi:MAG: DUF1501 domain-containing protein [Pseudomonadota bacterium]